MKRRSGRIWLRVFLRFAALTTKTARDGPGSARKGRMSSQTQDAPRSMAMAMIGAAAVTAQIVSGKATRDALFLTSLDYTALPTMLVVTSVVSILLVALNTRAARRLSPSVLVPAMFAVSGLLFLVEWLVRPLAPAVTAMAVYLHISCAGPLLGSGFWLVSTERFDPRTAKQWFG